MFGPSQDLYSSKNQIAYPRCLSLEHHCPDKYPVKRPTGSLRHKGPMGSSHTVFPWSIIDGPQSTYLICFSIGYENEDAYTMEIFDTRNVKSYKVVDVLKASCDAPVVFQTPTTIKGIHYIDGGVGGNCPLVQAIPRMQELHNAKKLACKGSRPNSALSIAPPQMDGKILKIFKT